MTTKNFMRNSFSRNAFSRNSISKNNRVRHKLWGAPHA